MSLLLPPFFLEQRFCRGESSGTPVPLPLVCSYIQQVASALQYAHQQGVIHRDVKPQNMLLAFDGNTIWLSDFGVTTIAHSEHSLRTQDMAGTVPYMAPEQLQRKPRPASDQYALGIVAYEWLTSTRPFTGSAVEIITQHLHTPPPSLREKIPTLPAAVEAVILQALSKEPQERFVDLNAFARALQEASQSAHSQPAPATPSAHVVVPSVTSPPPHNPGPILMPVPPENRPPQFPATVDPASNPSTHRSFTQPAIPQPSGTILPHHAASDEKIATLPSDTSSQSRSIAHVPITPALPHRTRSRMTIILLLAGLVLLLIVSSTFLYPTILNNYIISPKATATSVHLTTTALAKSAVIATAASQVYATATTQQGVMFGFDPAHTNWNRYERVLNVSTLSRLKLQWIYKRGNKTQINLPNSSPAVAGVMLYIGSEDGKLYVFDATCWQACQPLWSYTTGDAIGSSPVIANGMLYIDSGNKLYAFGLAA